MNIYANLTFDAPQPGTNASAGGHLPPFVRGNLNSAVPQPGTNGTPPGGIDF